MYYVEIFDSSSVFKNGQVFRTPLGFLVAKLVPNYRTKKDTYAIYKRSGERFLYQCTTQVKKATCQNIYNAYLKFFNESILEQKFPN